MTGIYKFNPEDARRFAMEQGIKTFQRGEELIFEECPYCHGREGDNKKKFSINLETGQFQCFRASCGAKGNMVTLSKDFDFSLGREADEYYRQSKKFWRLRQPKAKIVPKDPAVKYLEDRGIPKDITEKYEISTMKDNDSLLMFPFFDEKGELIFAKVRDMNFQKGVSSWKEKPVHDEMKPILFGMNHCEDFEQLVITEGEIDSLSVATAGVKNAVSVPMGAKGWTWVSYCWDWLHKFKEIVVFGDCEDDHITLLDELRTRFPNRIKHVREEDYQGCKDANELLQKHGADAVRKAVEQAVLVPIRRVIDLSEVKSVNLYDIEKLKTGINAIDSLLYGGLPFGGVTLIGGKRGEGKSTLASQIMVNAVNQGYTIMVYSGEMTNDQFKYWFNCQAVGPSRIVESKTKGEYNRGVISKDDLSLLDSWYRERAYIYDNSAIDGEETDSLLDIIRNTIMQYGARVILIDNLMTAMYDEPSEELNKYDRQGRFVQQLAKIATEMNCLIILVAHMKKGNSGDVNEDISGSGDITNLASVTLSYNRDDDLTEDQRKIVIAKNRLFGKINLDGFVMEYDEKSKRIFGSGDDVNRHFGWEALSFIQEDGETPFDDPVFDL